MTTPTVPGPSRFGRNRLVNWLKTVTANCGPPKNRLQSFSSFSIRNTSE